MVWRYSCYQEKDFDEYRKRKEEKLILGNHIGPALLMYKFATMIMPESFVLFPALVASFFSHFFMDMIPHKDWTFVEGEVNKEKLIMIAFVDVGLCGCGLVNHKLGVF